MERTRAAACGLLKLFYLKAKGQSHHKALSLQIGCNAVSWAPAVVPGSLIDQPSAQKPNYIEIFASGICDNFTELWEEEEDNQWEEEQKLEANSNWVRDVAWAYPPAPSPAAPRMVVCSFGPMMMP